MKGETAEHGKADSAKRAGGFSVVLGNPPWERAKLQEQEFFAHRDPSIAGATNAALFAVAMLALYDKSLAKKLADFRVSQTEKVLAKSLPEA